MQLIKRIDRAYYASMMTLVVPLILQNLINASVTLVDNLMVGTLGDVALGAVNITSQFYLKLFNIIIFGIVSGALILKAQFWGVSDTKNFHRVMGIELIAGGGLGLIFTALTIFAPDRILSLYSNDPAVIEAGAAYLSTFSLIFLIHPITMIYANAHRASGNTRLPMVAIASSLVIKLGLNYLFIYGNLGFPALGIRGAALATLLAKLIELFLLLFFTYRHETPVSAPLHELFDFDRTLTLKAARSILPVIVNEGLWGLGTNVYSAIYATISTTSIAAVSAVSPIDTLMFTLFFSLGDSCGILIGNHLGRGERQIPYNYARRTVMLSGSLGALTGLIVFLFRDPILGLYTLSPEAHEYARGLLTILCASLPIRTIAYAMMIGTLRSGGDIRYCMVVDLTTIWLVGIPVSLILARVFHFPITIVYFGYVLDELVKVIVVSRRIRSKKWMHTLTTSS